MPQFCAGCGAQMADGAAVCAACGKAGGGGGGGAVVASGNENIIALLCYSPVALIGIIIALVVEPYSKSKFTRFHAFQSLFLAIGVFVLWIGFIILGIILAFLGPAAMIMVILYPLFGLSMFVLMIFMMIKAYQGQIIKLPVVGNFAAKAAGL